MVHRVYSKLQSHTLLAWHSIYLGPTRACLHLYLLSLPRGPFTKNPLSSALSGVWLSSYLAAISVISVVPSLLIYHCWCWMVPHLQKCIHQVKSLISLGCFAASPQKTLFLGIHPGRGYRVHPASCCCYRRFFLGVFYFIFAGIHLLFILRDVFGVVFGEGFLMVWHQE